VVRVQTPQAFRFQALARAHRDAEPESATDDAALLEHIGLRVAAVEGEHDNIKITTQEDMRLASLLRKRRD
jgi:2-C-methyl-D-erythritol 4-phosphate cytidylyltransferase